MEIELGDEEEDNKDKAEKEDVAIAFELFEDTVCGAKLTDANGRPDIALDEDEEELSTLDETKLNNRDEVEADE